MTHSMTAFASHTHYHESGMIQWDIRSFNHRYLDLHFVLPPGFGVLETPCREITRGTLHRGRVDCQLSFTPAKSTALFKLNETLLTQLIATYHSIENRLSLNTPLNPIDLLRWPDLLQVAQPQIEALSPSLLDALQTALTDLLATRRREGEKLAASFTPRLQSITAILERVRTRLPQVLNLQRQRLLHKLAEASSTLDSPRLEQEIVLFAHKMDVAEEMERLNIHIQEVSRLLNTPGHHGRRLDFLMQEMNREANTLGAKTNDSDIIHASVEVKVLIDQMREQIQNIE